MFENLVLGEEYIFHFHNGRVIRGSVEFKNSSICCIRNDKLFTIDFEESEVRFIEPVIDLDKDVINKLPNGNLDKILKELDYMVAHYGRDCVDANIVHEEILISFKDENLAKEFFKRLESN